MAAGHGRPRAASPGASAGTQGAPALPSISLPKGGGAIRGIDEKLTAGQPTGTAALSVRVFTSPTRQRFGPELALGYDSGSGNGPFGLGWSLNVASITRKTSKGLPRYDDDLDTDVFILAGAEDLTPLLVQSGGTSAPDRFEVSSGGRQFDVRRYRPRVESVFTRIERWQDASNGEVHWRTVSADNVTSLFGQSPASRISDPADATRVFSWLLDLSFDDRGNAIVYEYKPEDASNVPPSGGELRRSVTANRYLKRIRYGNETPHQAGNAIPDQWCFEVVLDYGEHDAAAPSPDESTTWPCRPDPFSSYRPGFEVRTYRSCRRILMFHTFADELGAAPVIVRSTELSYSTDTAPDPGLAPPTLLASIVHRGWRARTGGGLDVATLPALELDYTALALDGSLKLPGADSLPNLVGGFDRDERWLDLDGEGLQGIVSEDDGAWYYKRNLSAWNPDGGGPRLRLGELEQVASKPAAGSRPELQLTSLNGTGNLCAVRFSEPGAGWFEREPDGSWAPLRLFEDTANVDWSDPNLRFVDVDGDGLADVLITDDEVLTYYGWIVERGFAAAAWVSRPYDEDRGPALVFADGTNSVFLADMSGDGLSDLVRIRVGEVCYWPNLGYGRFGAKISMDRAPVFDTPDRFDPRRVALADLDGTGTADLVYFAARTTTAWFNRSGAGWTEGHALEQFPIVDDVARASAMDVLGIGTAAIVWSSPLPAEAAEPIRYIDLTAGVKPYLLAGVTDNLGGHTALEYTSSTSFYLQDRAVGEPWITRLPFPVHVVSRVEVSEAISRTRTVTTYSYHHGFYDGIEREFRGFGRIDQLDADTMPKQSGIGEFTAPQPVDGDRFALPPVWTRTWYHTGAFFGRDDLAARLAAEYYQGDSREARVGDTVLPVVGSADELREACRALRGRVLRQEVYAQDGSPAAVHPYTTAEHRYRIDRLQPDSGSSFAAFRAHELEAVTSHYERDPSDPRVMHELVLETDEYGHVTKRATVGYARRIPQFPQQQQMLLCYTEDNYANVADQQDWYRLGLPVETREYELTGIDPAPGQSLFDPDTLRAQAIAAAQIPYDQQPTAGTAQRRLLARRRTIYRKDDLSATLAVGEVESLALVDRVYDLFYTAGLLDDLFVTPGKLTAAALATALANEGAFVDLDADRDQWAPTARTLYAPDPANPDPAFARAHFYLPHGEQDPWGNVATVVYDPHNQLVTQATDAVGNATTAAHNYRVLAAWLVTDPNLNRNGVRFDPLAMVVATAAMGKLQPDGSDEGDHLDTTTPEPVAGDDPTTRVEYDLGAYRAWSSDPAHDPDHPVPVSAHTLARVRHKDPATPWIESYVYSDGLGRVALTKAQAEPGDAPERDANGKLVRDAQGKLVFAHTDHRWVGSGRVVYDNKGNPVKSYEPFFDSSPAYDDETDLVDWGVTAITRYDPLSRAVRVDNPNGSYRTVEFDPWQRLSHDENDTVLTSAWYAARQGGALGGDESDAANKAAAHANTPEERDLDPLGRTFRTVADNGAVGRYATVLALDIDGRVRGTADALGRTVLSSDWCPAGHELHRVSVDAGERWILHDAGAGQLRAWDAREHMIRPEYDALRRPTNLHVTTGAGPERLAEQLSYGESLALATAQAKNARGAVYQRRDQVGVDTTEQRDFKGNTLRTSRQLLTDYRDDPDWAAAPGLSPETFTAAATFDALNRIVTRTTPDGSVSEISHNERGLLAATSVSVRGAASTPFVAAIAYDAKAQRNQITYGNGASTLYAYDPETFRLVHMTTTRPAGANPLQDLAFAYDPVGNITRIHDSAHQTIFYNNQVVSPDADYTYDAIYRLTRATGREQIGQAGRPQTTWDDSARTVIPLPSDGQAMRNYTESYSYDPIGNFTSLAHTATSGNWTRAYAYDEPSPAPTNNHLTSTNVAGIREPYTYDAHGNIASMPHLTQMNWDWKDQLTATARQAVNAGTPETTNFRYDASGERARKVTDNQNRTLVSQRLYFGDYEVYREYSAAGDVTLERQTLHVHDGARRICIVETTTIDAAVRAGGQPQLARYQVGNHLGSAMLELDAASAIVSYEEFYPYGSTSYQSGRSAAEVSLKRYRYTAKERDGETGFYYEAARYYLPWLGRWLSCDPHGMTDSTSLYSYVADRPTRLVDPSGMDEDEPDDTNPPTGPPQDPPGVPAPGASLTQPGGQQLTLTYPLSFDTQGSVGSDTRGVPNYLGVFSFRRLVSRTVDVGATVGTSGSSAGPPTPMPTRSAVLSGAASLNTNATVLGATLHLGTPGRNEYEEWGHHQGIGAGLYVGAGVILGAGPGVFSPPPSVLIGTSSAPNPYASALGAFSVKLSDNWQFDWNVGGAYNRFAAVAGSPLANISDQFKLTLGVNFAYTFPAHAILPPHTQLNFEAIGSGFLARSLGNGALAGGAGWGAGAGIMFPAFHDGSGMGAVGVNVWVTQDAGSTLGGAQPVLILPVLTLAGTWR